MDGGLVVRIMVSVVQSVHPVSRSLSRCAGLMAAAFAVLAGGCSADIARFDFANANLADPNQTSSIPKPTEPMRDKRSGLLGDEGTPHFGATPASESPGGAYYPPQTRRSESVASQPLSDATPPAPQSPPAAKKVAALEPASARATPVVPTTMMDHAQVSKGREIEVMEGDTLFGLAKRNQVSMNDLMNVNGLTSTNLKPGQKLYLPQTRIVEKAVPHTAPVVPTIAAPAPAQAPADWTGSYTVQAGDSLYGIASRNKIKVADLQRYNAITDARKVKPGLVLRMPGSVGGAAPQAQPAATTTAEAVPSAAAPGAMATPGAQPANTPATILNGEQKVAALTPPNTATDATPSAQALPAAPAVKPSQPGSGSIAGTPKLRWPVEGKIISGFGRRPDGTHNDGVNVSVPAGTEIHAAEDGTVAYSGNELKGYGNLLLIRHDNGWVTAYAHADHLLVQRGDTVKRGQVIAKAGKTGQVDQPQVHFEVRQGQKPVDPTPFMEKM